MSKTQQETGQQRERVMTPFAIPAFDPDAVDLGRTEWFAQVEPVTDEEIDRVAVRTNLGTGEDELGELINVLMDMTVEFDYNDHA